MKLFSYWRIAGLIVAACFATAVADAQTFQEESKSLQVNLVIDGQPAEANSPAIYYLVYFDSETASDHLRIEQGAASETFKAELPLENLHFVNVTWIRKETGQTSGELTIQKVQRDAPGVYTLFVTS